jgi:hypothetical protein
MNIIVQGLYIQFLKIQVRKEILLEMYCKHVSFKCEHIIELIYFPKPNFSNLFEISVTKIIHNSISHAPYI